MKDPMHARLAAQIAVCLLIGPPRGTESKPRGRMNHLNMKTLTHVIINNVVP